MEVTQFLAVLLAITENDLVPVLIRNSSVFVLTGVIIHMAARFSLEGKSPVVNGFVIAALLVVLRGVLVIVGLPPVLSVLSVVVFALIIIQVVYDTTAGKAFMILGVSVVLAIITSMVLGALLELAGFGDLITE